MRNKTAIEVDEAEETLEILDGGGLRIVSDGLDMGGKGSDSSSGDMVAKEVHRGLGKRAFCRIDENAIGSQDGEELVEVMEMLLKGGAGNEDIIEIDKSKRKILENVVH